MTSLSQQRPAAAAAGFQLQLPLGRALPRREGPSPLATFLVNSATECAIQVVAACAADGSAYWGELFEADFVDAVSEEPTLESLFFGSLLQVPGLPFAAPIIEEYLRTTADVRRRRLFHLASFKRSGQPCNVCYHAQREAPDDPHLMAAVAVMRRYGYTDPEEMGGRGLNVEDVRGPRRRARVATGDSLSPHTAGLLRYLVERVGAPAVDVVVACALSGDGPWQDLFKLGLIKVIAGNSDLEGQFIRRLCTKPVRPHAAPILHAYLSQLTEARRRELLGLNEATAKSHFAIDCFSGASYTTKSAEYMLMVLEVLFANGLDMAIVFPRCAPDVERATLLENRAFLSVFARYGGILDDELVRVVMRRASRPETTLAMLLDGFEMPLQRVMKPKLMAGAKPAARTYLLGRALRATRLPPSDDMVSDDEDLEDDDN